AVAEIGTCREVRATVALGSLHPEDVEVQLIHGIEGQGGELTDTEVVPMEPAGEANGGPYAYAVRFTCEQAGRYGVTVRVVPRHPDLVTPAELGRVAWAG